MAAITSKRISGGIVVLINAATPAAKVATRRIECFVESSTRSTDKKHLIGDHMMRKIPTEASYSERTVSRKKCLIVALFFGFNGEKNKICFILFIVGDM